MPSNFIEALLLHTDLGYAALASARPRAPLLTAPHASSGHGHGARAAAVAAAAAANGSAAYRSLDEAACREEKACRIAFRDAANLRLDGHGRELLRRAIASHVLFKPASIV